MADGQSCRESMERHLAALGRLRARVEVVDAIAADVARCLAAGGKVMTCGNGGSAAEALHFAEELVGRFDRERAPLAGLCLAADATAISCIANDYGYEAIFARQVAALGRAEDRLVALSTSGRSANVLRALEAARSKGIRTIGLLGRAGSPAEGLCDLALTMDGDVATAPIQEMHLVVIHLVLERLEG